MTLNAAFSYRSLTAADLYSVGPQGATQGEAVKKLGILAVAVVALCGCSDAVVRPIVDDSGPLKNYVLGREQDAYVGQSIVRVKDVGAPPIKAFASRTAFSVSSLGGGTVNYPAGSEVRVDQIIDYDEDHYFVVQLAPPLPEGVRLLIEDSRYYEGNGLINKTTLFDPCEKASPICVKPASIEFVAVPQATAPTAGGNFEIIYSGATKDTINLLYREYTADDLARGAFSQNLTYDRASPIIRFRNLQIRVVEANNQMLRYVVEADGPTPGAPPTQP